MSQTIRAAGDTWEVRLGERPPASGRQLVMFFCTSTSQRPYRVADVSRDAVPDADALSRLRARELRALFDTSLSMDVPRGYPTYDT